MGEPACDLLEAELALDRLEAELATELPAHLRAFARAYAAGAAEPPAPEAARRASSLVAARRALVHPLLADRAAALVRLLAPIAIEGDPRVAVARAAERTWAAYDRLRAARDQAARERFGIDALALAHRLFGVTASAPPPGWPAPLAGWTARDAAVDAAWLGARWAELAQLHGVAGRCTIQPATGEARPRAFVVEPGREVIVVTGPLDSPAARFAALHELGHAVAALAVAAPLPRVVDEAAAAYIARRQELPGAGHVPLAEAARHRRRALAAVLDRVERGAIEDGALDRGAVERPPWALWHDPGAQAAYVAAEDLAERWWQELGPAPRTGAFAAAITAEHRRVDAASGWDGVS